MYNLTQFSLKEMTECGAALRKMGDGADRFEAAAARIVQYLYRNLLDGDGQPASALVRLFKTHPYRGISPQLQEFASIKLGKRAIDPSQKCFVLAGSAGQRPEWNDPLRSVRFRAIPLGGDEFIAQFPMFSQLLTQFGVDLHGFLQPGSNLLVDRHEKTFNVFYVQEAAGSMYIPSQEAFVHPYAIRSVLGFGAALPSGEIFAVILFAKIAIPREIADLFQTLALCSKVALLPFDGDGALM